jgi:hypothetical protein
MPRCEGPDPTIGRAGESASAKYFNRAYPDTGQKPDVGRAILPADQLSSWVEPPERRLRP